MPIRQRHLNGYKLIYEPEHPSSMKSENWKGWIYEHILIAESLIGRRLLENEVVHHLDCDRANNDRNNLLVIDRKQHTRLHAWIDNGAPVCESYRRNGVNSGKPKGENPVENKKCLNCGRMFFHRRETTVRCANCRNISVSVSLSATEKKAKSKECKVCGEVFFSKNSSTEHCSLECAGITSRKVDRPSKADLEKLVWEVPSTYIAKAFGVSDRAIGKWCKELGIAKPPRGYWTKPKAILSETSNVN